MQKYLVEFIGTFFFILTIVLSVNFAGAMAPLAIGSMLMVMVYAGGHISGGHYNPAVTLGVWMRGKCDTSDVPGYIISQIVGAALAAVVAGLLIGMSGGEAIVNGTKGFAPVALADFLGTFALVWVVLHTATAKGTAGNSNYGLAIGFTVMSCAYALGSISGGAFNPAVATGLCISGLATWADFPAFLVGQFAAGALAAVLFKVVNGDD